jgi:signal peptidase I
VEREAANPETVSAPPKPVEEAAAPPVEANGVHLAPFGLMETPIPLALLVEEPANVVAESESKAQEPAPPPEDDGPWKTVWISPSASRRLTESLIIFVGAILFLRALAVEPFGVPTGSMAPTLHGNHKCTDCPRCGFPIRVGEPSDDQRHGARRVPADPSRYPPVTCPNCGQSNIDMTNSLLVSGDRLLVDKNIYQIRKPRRWEPAVFRCPSDLEKPYVKRVVGLPDESVFIADGDIWINGQLARKTLKEARECRVLVSDMNYPPKPDGWAKRWVLESNLPPLENADSPYMLADRELRLDGGRGTPSAYWITYRHHVFDEVSGHEREESIRDSFVYNSATGDEPANSIHDFFIEFEIEIVAGSGSLQCRMNDGRDQLIASCPIGERGDAQLRQEGGVTVRTLARRALAQGSKYKIEMSFVDRRVSFAVDGSEPFPAFDLPELEERKKPLPGQPWRNEVKSPFAVAIQGATVIIRDFKIYRDIYYRSTGQNAVSTPLQLLADEYFMLGDNSANSHDSRSWPIPAVPERNFLGKPFLLHQPSRVAHLSIGGRERIFQSIDWSRIRFLR